MNQDTLLHRQVHPNFSELVFGQHLHFIEYRFE